MADEKWVTSKDGQVQGSVEDVKLWNDMCEESNTTKEKDMGETLKSYVQKLRRFKGVCVLEHDKTLNCKVNRARFVMDNDGGFTTVNEVLWVFDVLVKDLIRMKAETDKAYKRIRQLRSCLNDC